MILFRALRGLGPIDLKNIARDGMYLMLIILPFLAALLVRYGLPAITPDLSEFFQTDFRTFYPLIMAAVIVTPAVIVGVITGFLLLDERDEHTLTALQVTPVSLNTYLLYRLSVPMILGFAVMLGSYYLANITPLPLSHMIPVAAVMMLTAPLTTLFLGAFAANKVAGLAAQKFLNMLQQLPVVAFFLNPPWEYLVWIMPTYWPFKMFWQASAGEPYLFYFIGGLIVNGGYIFWLAARFRAKQVEAV